MARAAVETLAALGQRAGRRPRRRAGGPARHRIPGSPSSPAIIRSRARARWPPRRRWPRPPPRSGRRTRSGCCSPAAPPACSARRSTGVTPGGAHRALPPPARLRPRHHRHEPDPQALLPLGRRPAGPRRSPRPGCGCSSSPTSSATTSPSIGSGPCVPDPATAAEVRRLLEQRRTLGPHSRPPRGARRGVGVGGNGRKRQSPGDAAFARVTLELIASNRLALEAAAKRAAELGLAPVRGGDAARRGGVGDRGECSRYSSTKLRPPEIPQPAAPRPLLHLGRRDDRHAGRRAAGPRRALSGAGARGGPGARRRAARAWRCSPPAPTAATVRPMPPARSWTAAPGAPIAAAGRDPARDLAAHDAYRALDAAGALLKAGADRHERDGCGDRGGVAAERHDGAATAWSGSRGRQSLPSSTLTSTRRSVSGCDHHPPDAERLRHVPPLPRIAPADEDPRGVRRRPASRRRPRRAPARRSARVAVRAKPGRRVPFSTSTRIRLPGRRNRDRRGRQRARARAGSISATAPASATAQRAISASRTSATRLFQKRTVGSMSGQPELDEVGQPLAGDRRAARRRDRRETASASSARHSRLNARPGSR